MDGFHPGSGDGTQKRERAPADRASDPEMLSGPVGGICRYVYNAIGSLGLLQPWQIAAVKADPGNYGAQRDADLRTESARARIHTCMCIITAIYIRAGRYRLRGFLFVIGPVSLIGRPDAIIEKDFSPFTIHRGAFVRRWRAPYLFYERYRIDAPRKSVN